MFWTKASVQYFGEDGSVQQSMLFETVDHTATTVSCEAISLQSPCIASGAAKLTVNGAPVTTPGGTTRFSCKGLPLCAFSMKLLSMENTLSGATNSNCID